VCVSWQDAKAYVTWLNGKARQKFSASGDGPYRLPSEAEWEYAARAGTSTNFYWGDDDTAAPAHAWFNGNSGCEKVEGLFCDHGRTHPVGAKPPNAFGLYDMAGNVWQWTEDCYDNSYVGIPADGRANDTPSSDSKAKDGQGNCLRVDRGGSWMFPAWLLRSATRERNPADYRNDIMGFRVARTLREAIEVAQMRKPYIILGGRVPGYRESKGKIMMKWISKWVGFVLVAITLLVVNGVRLTARISRRVSLRVLRARGPRRWWTGGTTSAKNSSPWPRIFRRQIRFQSPEDQRTFAEIFSRRRAGFRPDTQGFRIKYRTQLRRRRQSFARRFQDQGRCSEVRSGGHRDGAQVIQRQGDAGLDKTSSFFGNRLAHNSIIWTFAIEHSGEHYGQLVVYYRANNLVPPDSRRDSAADLKRLAQSEM